MPATGARAFLHHWTAAIFCIMMHRTLRRASAALSLSLLRSKLPCTITLACCRSCHALPNRCRAGADTDLGHGPRTFHASPPPNCGSAPLPPPTQPCFLSEPLRPYFTSAPRFCVLGASCVVWERSGQRAQACYPIRQRQRVETLCKRPAGSVVMNASPLVIFRFPLSLGIVVKMQIAATPALACMLSWQVPFCTACPSACVAIPTPANYLPFLPTLQGAHAVYYRR